MYLAIIRNVKKFLAQGYRQDTGYQDTGDKRRYQKGQNDKKEVHYDNCCLVISD